MNMWKWLGRLCSLTPGTKRWSLKLFHCWKRFQYQNRFGKRGQTQPRTVIFEAYMGKRYACSPRALYEAMLADPAYDSWEKIWAFRSPEDYRFLEKEPHTRVVAYRKKEYYQAFARAKYWITNSRLPRELLPRKDQEYIQCWHGTPLKKLGYDLEQYAEENSSLMEVRENYSAEAGRVTRMPSPSPFYTEKMISAFGLERLGKEKIFLEAGYPRNDRLFTADPREVEGIREKLGIPPGKKVILYAPTWRENQHLPGEGYTYQPQADFSNWKRRLGEEWVVLFRTHYFISSRMDFSGMDGFLRDVSAVDEINELYLAADVLITDYSSVFFDFANLNRPILFYMYDYRQYREEMRDFYFDTEELPGPVYAREEDLLEGLEDISRIRNEYRDRYRQFNQKFNPHRQPCSKIYLKEWMDPAGKMRTGCR